VFSFHWPELIALLVVALIIFGPKRLPEIGGALGKGIKEFRKSTTEIEEQVTGKGPAEIPPTHSADVRVPEKPVDTTSTSREADAR
jgi:sec-independent protein translocase protein TatA